MTKITQRITKIEAIMGGLIISALTGMWVWIFRDWLRNRLQNITYFGLNSDEILLIAIPVAIIIITVFILDRDRKKRR